MVGDPAELAVTVVVVAATARLVNKAKMAVAVVVISSILMALISGS